MTNMAASGEQEDRNGKNILIAYFIRLDNTDATLDEIAQGGGPYGSLGDSWESSDMDAIASASITLMDGEAKGNVEAMAQMIGSLTGGDLFSIRTVQKYPVNYDELINVGGEERREEYDFSGKTILPFCSHGGGGLGQSQTAIAKLVPDANMAEGLAINYSGGSGMPDDVAAWLDANGIERQ